MQIELKNICKRFGDVIANEEISLTLSSGSIHGLLGENGTGKSTLMKILAGYCQKDSGSIWLDGVLCEYHDPASALNLGIGMLYQEPHDFPRMSVLDNFKLGQSKTRSSTLPQTQTRFIQTAQRIGVELPLFAPVESLSFGERQQLEIVRLIDRNIKVLILDEPTTGITDYQKKTLFAALNTLAAEGKVIILLSHKMEDVTALCESVTVLRNGRVTGRVQQPFAPKTLLDMMFSDRPAQLKCESGVTGKTLLEFERVSFLGGRSSLRSCTVSIQQGELIGLAGIEGSGQDHFLRIACGLKSPSQGKVFFNQTDMSGKSYHAFKHEGVAFIPTSRLEEGLVGSFTIAEHCLLNHPGQAFFISLTRSRQAILNHIGRFRIKGQPQTAAAHLSGGNQQRLLLSFLSPASKLILIENPTRGLDVTSARWVWNDLNAYCEKQATIVFSSPEIDELVTYASRILVFYNGEIVKDVQTKDTSMEELTRAIAGVV